MPDVVRLTLLPPIWPPWADMLPAVAVAFSVPPATSCPPPLPEAAEPGTPPTSIDAAVTSALPVAAITPVCEPSAPGVVSVRLAAGARDPDVKTPASNWPPWLLSTLAAVTVNPPWPLMEPPAFPRAPVVPPPAGALTLMVSRPALASTPLLVRLVVGLNVALEAEVIDPELVRLAPEAVSAPDAVMVPALVRLEALRPRVPADCTVAPVWLVSMPAVSVSAALFEPMRPALVSEPATVIWLDEPEAELPATIEPPA